ncbi:MAG: TIGR01777 family protein [Acidobacteria bacterium]|nr:MAG: TIGR01777 family protein [Acidobacteriota bacterium]
MADKVVIAGGTGFLGRHVAAHLAGLGHEVVVLARHRPAREPAGRFVGWDARTLGPWVEELDGAAALINLAGRTVDCVKTPDHCDEILRSRVESTLVLGRALEQADDPPETWVQMSTAHIYGDPPETVCDEDSPTGYGLAPFVGRAWEDALAQAAPDAVRTVVLRTSFVLGHDGGAVPRMVRLVRWGLGGTIGSGRQGISWIHVDDVARIIRRAIEDDTMRGTYVVSAPNPVSQAEFMRALRRALGMPIGLPAREWMVRLGAPLLMRTDPELVLYGRYVIPRRLLREGFEFRFAELEPALAEIAGHFRRK